MDRLIFVNLPVNDLERSVKFYEQLGFVKQLQYTNELAAGMKWSDQIYFMLLTKPFYKKFIGSKSVVDAHAVSGAINTLSLESPKAVEAFIKTALAAGGKQLPKADIEMPDNGMSVVDIEDPDGNILEPFWMEMPG